MVCQFESRRTELRDNLVLAYTQSSETARSNGLAWYPEARRIVRTWAKADGISVSSVACIIAALSPQVSWETNIIAARALLDGLPVVGPFQASIRKANELYRRAREVKRYNAFPDMLRLFPCGPKVNCFARNLAGDDVFVTVDTHAIQAALNDVLATVTLKWTPYKVFAECYAHAAHEVSLAPATFQAIVWHAWKERYPTSHKKIVRRQW